MSNVILIVHLYVPKNADLNTYKGLTDDLQTMSKTPARCETSECQNHKLFLLFIILILSKSFICRKPGNGSKYFCISNMNELRLFLSSASSVLEIDGTTHFLIYSWIWKKQHSLELLCSFLHNKPLHHTKWNTSVVSYNLSKLNNYLGITYYAFHTAWWRLV